MTVDQLDLMDYALRVREAGQRVAVAHSDESYREAFTRAIRTLARRPQPFSADDVRALVGDPPEGTSPNIAGALITAAMKRGEIRFVAFTRSTRALGHANRVGTYLGVD